MRRILLLAGVLAFSPWGATAQDRPPPPAGGQPPRDGTRFLFISPMGEPFRVDRPERAWFAGADRNGDGRLDRAEFRADAMRWFKLLDRQGDGEIDPGDIEAYENDLVPEIHVGDGGGPGGGASSGRQRGGDDGPPGGGGRGGGPPGGSGGGGGGPPGGGGGGGRGSPPGGGGSDRQEGGQAAVRTGAQGAARYGYLDLAEPITPADTNFNRGVDEREFARAADARFRLLDRNGDGAITPGELPSIDTRLRGRAARGRPPGGPPRGAPPRAGDDAPDRDGGDD